MSTIYGARPADGRYPSTTPSRPVAIPINNLTTKALAQEFATILASWLGPVAFKEMVARQDPESPFCASHDFCDANMAMQEAFTKLHARNSDTNSTDDVGLINAAWFVARGANFFTDRPAR